MLNRTHPRSFIVALSMAAFVVTSASAQEASKSKFEPLTIQNQGSFAVGGKVITNPGSFNPKQPTRMARRCMATTPTSSTRFRLIRESFHSFFYTAPVSSQRPGSLLRMAERGFRPSFYAVAFLFT